MLGPLLTVCRLLSLVRASARTEPRIVLYGMNAAGPLTAADVMTSSEVAELLHMPQSSVEDLARRGEIPSKKIGRRRLYIRHKIETLLLS
jgi:excisionase family DNA binding protein